MSYKTELHCHSSDFSLCSNQTGAEKAELYISAGYTTVALTNHYSWLLPGWEDHESFTRRFFRAGEIMREAAGGRLNVITGMELRFRENYNDYLVYGMTEEMLLSMPDIHDLTIAGFYERAGKLGLLVIQAHPFRPGMVVTMPDYLDGVEVYNGTHDRALYNDTALFWAENFKEKRLIMTSGSDHHNAYHAACGGIETERQIKTAEELVSVLKSGDYRLLRKEE